MLVGQPTNVNSFFATGFSRVSFCRRGPRTWHKNSHSGKPLQGLHGFPRVISMAWLRRWMVELKLVKISIENGNGFD
jgi:hypothetical protein